MTLFHAASTMAAAAVSSLVSAIWEGAVLSLCVVVCLRMLPRLSAAVRSLIWMNVFLLLLLLHVIPLFLPQGTAGSMVMLRAGPQCGLEYCAGRGVDGAFVVEGGPVDGERRPPAWAGEPGDSGSGRCRAAGNSSGRAWARQAQSGTVHVEEVERPSVFGFFRPRILIPPALMESLPAEDLRQVVVHEMEHLRRGDDWTNLLQKVGLALFPLNPALLWVERRVCAERELACDDRVLDSGGARKAYATCLTRLAEYSIVRRSLSLALGAWERQSELVRRVNRLLRGPDDLLRGKQAALVTGSMLAGVLGGAIALAHAPQLVSFGPGARSAVTGGIESDAGISRGRLSNAGLRDSGGSMQLVKAVVAQRPVRSAFTAKSGQNKAARRTASRLRRKTGKPGLC